jgi:mono/diheme cytochrome c family protein
VLFAITTTGKVVLIVVAGTFIAFALLTAIVIPRRRPSFPGNRLGAFLALVGLLFVAQMSAVVWVAETQETEEHSEAAETEPADPGETEAGETEAGETEPAETEPAETEPAETGTGTEGETEPAETATEPAETGATTEGEGQGDASAGKEVFASAGCGGCHTLAAANSSGNVGPNLDDASPSFDKSVERVTDGQGAMPSFKDQLSEQQIKDVAAFVSQSTDD